MPKEATISRREFVKLHIITDVKGRKIVSCAVVRGRAHDSPVFREMIKKVPDGTGCVMLNAGYDARENYRMIHNTGRRPVICTHKNHVVRGFGPRARCSGGRKRILKSLKIRTTNAAWWNRCSRHSSAGLLQLFVQRNRQHKDCS